MVSLCCPLKNALIDECTLMQFFKCVCLLLVMLEMVPWKNRNLTRVNFMQGTLAGEEKCALTSDGRRNLFSGLLTVLWFLLEASEGAIRFFFLATQ